MPTRRSFLAGLSSIWAMPVLAQPVPRRESVLVIGAGIAGLACGHALQQAGFTVTILEARDRIGGRIHTNRSLGVPIDLGAAWIHGSKGNPITALAKDAQAQTVESDADEIELHRSAGQIVSAQQFEQAEKEFRNLRRRLREARKTSPAGTSIADAVAPILAQVDRELREIVRWQLFSEIELSLGAEAAALSLAAWDRDEAFTGPELVFPQGYDQLTTFLSKNLTIHRNENVQTIEVKDKEIVATTAGKTYRADRCVVTLPLGVLKARKVRFVPELPATKQDAIRRLGAGRFAKIAVSFEKPFWPKSLHRLAVTSEPHFEVWSLLPTHRSPTLVLLAGGSTAAKWETWKANVQEAEAGSLLNRIFTKIPQPKGVLVTQWGVDPFTMGAYSSVAPQASLKDFETLAEPVGQRLYFAGEATNREYPGTVHGAYLSGIREAKRLIRLVTAR